MNRADHSNPQTNGTPCPECGYDLRGHSDPARCPECGQRVFIGLSLTQAARWVDRRVLDLWSIAVLQSAGLVTGGVAWVAVRRGFAVAALLGLFSTLAVSLATLWFLALVPGLVMSARRPAFRALGAQQRKTMVRWSIFNLFIIAAPLLSGLILVMG